MNSISPECQELKTQYDACFNKWFKDKYLKGYPQDTMCAALFKSYQNCVKVRNTDGGKDVQAGSQSYASRCVSVRLFPTCISLLCILLIMN